NQRVTRGGRHRRLEKAHISQLGSSKGALTRVGPPPTMATLRGAGWAVAVGGGFTGFASFVFQEVCQGACLRLYMQFGAGSPRSGHVRRGERPRARIAGPRQENDELARNEMVFVPSLLGQSSSKPWSSCGRDCRHETLPANRRSRGHGRGGGGLAGDGGAPVLAGPCRPRGGHAGTAL